MSKFSLRVNTNTVPVEVNDKGDTIEVRLSDLEYMDKINDFGKLLDSSVRRLQELMQDGFELQALEKIKEFSNDSLTEEQRVEKANEFLEEIQGSGYKERAQIHNSLKVAFDKTFGDGACNKVFGNGEDVMPSCPMYHNFLQQFIPIVSKMIKNATQNISQRATPKRGGKK